VASSEQAGVLRIASEADEKNCGCQDAAVTPNNLYSLLDYRKKSTAYTAGAVVACPYHKEFLLKCTTAGTTSANSLDTKSVTKDSVITDGNAKWTVIASQIIDMSISGKTITVTCIDGTQKTLTTQDTGGDMTDYIVESYRNGTDWYEVFKSGKVRQGGFLKKEGGSGTVTFLKPFADTNYIVYGALCTASTAYGSDMTYRAIGILGEDKPASTTGMYIYQSSRGGKFWVAEGQGA
ncbi:MAG: hypothetical protein IKT51_06080, partial [Phascolarctobacterium sp.]|nr:hypothetical protein [Phascolarctobacterium sp.]